MKRLIVLLLLAIIPVPYSFGQIDSTDLAVDPAYAGDTDLKGRLPTSKGTLLVKVDNVAIPCTNNGKDICKIGSDGSFTIGLGQSLKTSQVIELFFSSTELSTPLSWTGVVKLPNDATVCNSVMNDVVANDSISGQHQRDLTPCSELVLAIANYLGDALAPASYDETILVNSAGDPPRFRDNPDPRFRDTQYFGWRKNDRLFPTLVRLNSNMRRLYYVVVAPKGRIFGLISSGNEQQADDATKTNLKVAIEKLRTIREDQGLTEPFAAMLETYFVPFTSTGSNNVPSAYTAANHKNQTFAAGFLSFESDHLRTRKIRFGDISFGGRIGIAPTQTLVTVSGLTNPTTNAVDNRPKSILQSAFNWRLNARANMPLGHRSEFAPIFAWGQNILLSDTVAVGPTTTNTTSIYGGNTQSGAWFWEGGGEYRIYPYQLDRVRDEKKFLLPSFSFSTGFRKDSRFSGLERQEFGNFSKPMQRWYMRSFVTLTNVFERNPAEQSKTQLFNVGLGFEYDSVWGVGAGSPVQRLTVPINSRIYINASIDLVGAFSKQGAK